jgi:hypothetical protein
MHGLTPGIQSQDATPATAPPAADDDGVTDRAVASCSLEILAPGTASLSLGPITLAPGAILPFDPTDPAAVLV